MQIVAEHVGKTKLTVFNIDNSIEPSILNEISLMINGTPIEQTEVRDVRKEDVRKSKTDDYKTPEVIVLNRTTCNADVSKLCKIFIF